MEKCRKLLEELLTISRSEPPTIQRQVKTLVQELVDAQVDAALFSVRLEKLINAHPQICLINFLEVWPY